MVNIEIDGRKIEAEAGSMVIQAADAAGIYIPRFCYHNKLSVAANCRMCLVEVEKAPKPLPACATPVTEGMKVFTRSARAIDAQKGTMEFLLINHPLDCPICDQGGECELQDLAVGYGGDVSRFAEKKRVVPEKNLGPLIATDMTRCIHCTRCVRFGQEVAGIMELGATGRGEHMEIGTHVERNVGSELSGNMIDLCPVGALTSKPFRYSARTWELASIDGVSAHDAVGSNLALQVRGNRVMRVLPRDNESINECWLSDRDRFAYEALNSDRRLTAPMVRDKGGQWRSTDWQSALEAAVQGLQSVIGRHGAAQLGALVAPNATTEECYLAQKLLRALGSDNVDHRLRQGDFRGDASAPLYPGFGVALADLERRAAVFIIGSNVRKEQPIIGLRLRKAQLAGSRVMALNPVDYDFNFDLAHRLIVAPLEMPASLARIARSVADTRGIKLPQGIRAWASGRATAAEQGVAEALVAAGADGSLLLGQLAVTHELYSELQGLADFIADATGASCGVMQDANSAGAWIAGAVPHRGPRGEALSKPGRDAHAMVQEPLKGYVLLGVEPELDCLDGSESRRAVSAADFVVVLSPFITAATEYAHVLLPVAAFTETGGSFVNGEGRLQSFTGAVTPPGEARPAWKVLRVLGNMLGLDGFDYTTVDEVRGELAPAALSVNARTGAGPEVAGPPAARTRSEIDLERIYEVPLYATDMIVRRAPALQACTDNPPPAVRINADQARRLGLDDGVRVNAHMGKAIVGLSVVVDDRIPAGCILIPGGYENTAVLGGPGIARVVRA